MTSNGLPIKMLDRKYNLYRMANHSINLGAHPACRTYQTIYEMGIRTPPHTPRAPDQ